MDPREFVVEETRLLDRGEYDTWKKLFADDGRYWVPLGGREQTSATSQASIAYEDHLLLGMRIDRLKNPKAHSQHPRSRSQHVLQTPVVTADDGDTVSLSTPFIYIESRGERQILLTGTAEYLLVRSEGGYRIIEKRVNLLNADQPLPAIQLFI